MEKAVSNSPSDIEKRVEDSSSGSLAGDGADFAPAASAIGKRVWLKLDLWLLPVVSMFYFLSFLVRFVPFDLAFKNDWPSIAGSYQLGERSNRWPAR